jgi:hypothetical protein
LYIGLIVFFKNRYEKDGKFRHTGISCTISINNPETGTMGISVLQSDYYAMAGRKRMDYPLTDIFLGNLVIICW